MGLVGQRGRKGERGCTGGEQMMRQGWGRRRLARRTRGLEEDSATGLDRDLCNRGEGFLLQVGGGKVQCT